MRYGGTKILFYIKLHNFYFCIKEIQKNQMEREKMRKVEKKKKRKREKEGETEKQRGRQRKTEKRRE